MELLIGFLPLIILISIYWIGYKLFKRKHGLEVASPMGNRPYGIHGWLAFFIFSSYFIAPIYSFGILNSNFSKQENNYPVLLNLPGYHTYKLISYLMLLVIVVWQIIIAKNLRNNWTADSLKNAKILCFTAPILTVISDMITAQFTMSVTPNAEMIGSYLTGFIGSYVWGLYFIRSQRCKNTYLENVVFADEKSDPRTMAKLEN